MKQKILIILALLAGINVSAATRDGSITSSGFVSQFGRLVCQSIASTHGPRYEIRVHLYGLLEGAELRLTEIGSATQTELAFDQGIAVRITAFQDGKPYVQIDSEHVHLFIPLQPDANDVNDVPDFEARFGAEKIKGDLQCRWSF